MYPELMEELLGSCREGNFDQGDVLLNGGEYVQVIPLLIDGLVKVYKEEEEGNEVLLYYIKAGESCIMSVTTCMKNEKSKVKAVVEESSRIILVPAEVNRKLTQSYPQWNEFFFELFNSKYEELLHFISILTFSNKDIRLKEYLIREVELKKEKILKITHQKIAYDLGSSREVISRLLKKLEKESFLSLGHGTIEVLD
ncbi:MAG: Crp/Fnr family transcriptional regulator [Bacteroidia bacterium]|nr:Crp/Fnr family transcriptional regulator [Bacteroidia bacterium]